MRRILLGLMMLAPLACGFGCAICASPYDYCAATVDCNDQPTGGFMTRQGSVLGGMEGAPVYAKAAPDTESEVIQAPTPVTGLPPAPANSKRMGRAPAPVQQTR